MSARRYDNIKRYLVDDIEFLIEMAKDTEKLRAENEKLKEELGICTQRYFSLLGDYETLPASEANPEAGK